MDRTLDKSFAQKRQSFIDVYQKHRSKKVKEVVTVERFIEQVKAYLKELKTLLKKHKKRKKLRAVEAVKTLIEKTEERIKRTKIEEK